MVPVGLRARWPALLCRIVFAVRVKGRRCQAGRTHTPFYRQNDPGILAHGLPLQLRVHSMSYCRSFSRGLQKRGSQTRPDLPLTMPIEPFRAILAFPQRKWQQSSCFHQLKHVIKL